MTWIVPKKNSLASLSVRDTEDLSWDLNNVALSFSKSFMWRGNVSPPQTWRTRLKREPWLRALSLRMSKPSHIKNLENVLISSLADFRVSPFPPPESTKATKTPDTSSPT